jgi:pimeloyl-ACP methyl ester carboxylesterase
MKVKAFDFESITDLLCSIYARPHRSSPTKIAPDEGLRKFSLPWAAELCDRKKNPPPTRQEFPRSDSSPIISRAMSTNSSLSEPAGGDLTVNGIRLHYLDWGGDGPPIVILHATGFLGRIYRPIAEALKSVGHVYSYDQRGHGDSEHPALDAIGWDHTAEGFLSARGLKDARALGHSAGATAIAAVASRRPDLTARAVLVEPVIVDPADPPNRPNELHGRTLKRKRVFDSVAAMYHNFEHKPPYNTWRKDILQDYCEFGTRPDRSRPAHTQMPARNRGPHLRHRARLRRLGASATMPGAATADVWRKNRQPRNRAQGSHRGGRPASARRGSPRRVPFPADGAARRDRADGAPVPRRQLARRLPAGIFEAVSYGPRFSPRRRFPWRAFAISSQPRRGDRASCAARANSGG